MKSKSSGDFTLKKPPINRNVEIRGFGSLKKKINKAKFVRNPKTNERIYKKETNKIHYKISKILHRKINNSDSNSL